MRGIYKYENQINGKIYIGQSFHLENRKKEHTFRYNKESSNNYNSLFYRALRKYGIKNFKYEILLSGDNFSREELNLAEIHFIELFDSYSDGYNMNLGGNYTSGNKKFQKEDILAIKKDLECQKETMRELSEKYNCSYSLITMINNGVVWSYIGNYNFPIRENKFLNQGGLNSNSKISDEKVLELRIEFIDKSLPQIYEENKKILSFSGMKKMLYGVTFKHLPVYKKHQKKWFLGETCIDYPRLEE